MPKVYQSTGIDSNIPCPCTRISLRFLLYEFYVFKSMYTVLYIVNEASKIIFCLFIIFLKRIFKRKKTQNKQKPVNKTKISKH